MGAAKGNGAAKSLRQQLLAIPLKVKRLDIPSIGFPVWIRELSASEAEQFTSVHHGVAEMTGAERGLGAAQANRRLALLALCDEHGARLFGDEEFEALADLSFGTVRAISDEATSFSWLQKEAVEEAGKDSAPSLDGASFTDSPGI